MELKDYIATARKRWRSISALAVTVLAAAVGATFLVTPMYDATAQVFVSVRSASTTSDLVQGSSFTQKQVKSYTDLVRTPRVLAPVVERLDLNVPVSDLATTITATNPLDTVLITITASSTDPDAAADIANAVSDSLAEQVTELEQPQNGPSPVQISTVTEATAPTSPSSPSLKVNGAIGLLLGLAAGIGLALLREALDTRVRDEDDIAAVTSSSVLATVGYDVSAPDRPLVVQTDPQSHRAESFRRLRTNLQFLDLGDRPKTIVVTSSLPGEGKSTTSVNLALSLADAGGRVLLIDADLRRPSVAGYMGLEGAAGLTTVLIGRAELEDVVQPWTNGLHILPSGQVPPNPSELLGSTAMARLLEEAADQYDMVLVDTPPLLPVTDAAILARLTGGALVVVGADKLHRAHLAESIASLETVNARVLGLVLNRMVRRGGDAYTYYDYSSHTDGPNRPTKRRSNRFSGPARRGTRMDSHQSVLAHRTVRSA